MKGYKTNPITMEVTTSTGKDFRDTMVVDGMAKDNPGRNDTNTLKQHVPDGVQKEGLGGKNRYNK